MAFDVKEYLDLVRLLGEHPEWKAELRSLLLSEELLRLPDLVRELAEAQKQTEARVEELAEAQKELTVSLKDLADAQKRTEGAVQQLVVIADRLQNGQAKLTGWYLEWKYSERAGAYFGRILKKVKVVRVIDLEDRFESKISEEELMDLLNLDILVRGAPRHSEKPAEVWLAVEVSSVIDRKDVQRARERAMILRKAGINAVPVVAGEGATTDAEWEAREYHVVVMRDGRIESWPEALADLPLN